MPARRLSYTGYVPSKGADTGCGRRQFAVRLTEQEASAVNALARTLDFSVSHLLRLIIRNAVKEMLPKETPE